MPSQLFEQFLDGVNRPLTWTNIDEYEGIGALRLLTGEERTQAEDILIGKLAEDDGRAANALADVGCTRALPALAERASASRSPTMRVFAARAMRDLGDDSGRDALTEVLRGGNWQERQAAVNALAEFPGAETEAALERAFADPDTTVRSSAISALLALRGLGAYDSSYRDLLGAIHGRMLSPLAPVRQEAQAELRAVLAHHEAGESPERLGLTWHADEETEPLKSFVASLGSDDSPGPEYALDGLDALDARDRKWVEDLLLIYLPRDPRAARSLARLGAERAVEPLRELARTVDGPVAEAARDALRRLASDAAG